MIANEDKPPYISFEIKQVEDRTASLEAGHYVATDVEYVIVTPRGSRDRIERVWSEWIAVKTQETREDRFPQEWLRMYKAMYEEWKNGREVPLNGTPIVTWPLISPGQQQTILGANIRTVEDLANASEEALNFIGIGSRGLKQKAVHYLEAAAGPGKIAERLTALETELDSLKTRNESLEEQNKALVAERDALEAKVKVPAK